MADILKIVLIILGLLSVYVSYWLLAEALFPDLVERASRCYRKPIRISFLGLAAAVVPVVLGLTLAKVPNPLLKLLGISLVVIPAMLGLLGSAGLTLRIGAGLPSPVDGTQPWRRVLRGGIVLALAFLLPVVGWIVLPLWVLISGFGAFILCVNEQRRGSKSPTPGDLIPTSQTAG
jgi:hypothetical protein